MPIAMASRASSPPSRVRRNHESLPIHRDRSDLGGSVPASEEIAKLSVTARKPLIPDVGLAPGLVNIIGEAIARDFNVGEIHNLYMCCGGLPQDPDNYLLLASNFSEEGIVNEYLGQCLVVKDGELQVARNLQVFGEFFLPDLCDTIIDLPFECFVPKPIMLRNV